MGRLTTTSRRLARKVLAATGGKAQRPRKPRGHSQGAKTVARAGTHTPSNGATSPIPVTSGANSAIMRLEIDDKSDVVGAATGGKAQRPGEPRGHTQGVKTVAEGWDAYAKRRRNESNLGDVWNNPAIMGLEIDDNSDVVGHLDRVVFAPFLGEPDVIVEIGPGGGRFTEALLPKCRILHAVDTSPHMIEALRERFGDDGRVVYHVADGTGLGMLPDASVDAAFSYGVFVHLQHWDIFNYVSEVERVLRPGGKAIIQHSNTFSELGWKRFRSEVPHQLNSHKRTGTFIVNSPELMAEFIRRAGLEPVDMVTNVAKRDCIALIRKP